MEATQHKSSLRASLSHRDFRLLLYGYAVSKTGDWLYSVALLVFVFNKTHSPAWVGAAAILRLVPMAVLGAVGGAVADRHERRQVMMTSDLLRASLMFALAILVAVSGPVVLALAIAMTSSAASTLYEPALSAITPAVVPERDLAAANASMSVVDNLALALGPAIGGILLYLGSSWIAFVINGVTFLVSAGLVTLVKTRSRASEESQQAGIVKRTVEGFRAAIGSSDAVIVLTCVVVATAIYGQETVLLILVSKQLLGTGSSGTGFLFAATGLGGLLGAGLTNKLGHTSVPGTTLAFSMCVCGTSLIAVSFVHWAPLAYAFMTLDGLGYIVLDVFAITLLQRTVASDVLARVFGIFMALCVAGTLAGAVIAPVTNALWGLRVALLLAGGTLPLVALLVSPKLREMNVRAQAKQLELAPIVDRLISLRIFVGATPQALEALAEQVHEERVEPGQNVVSEGEDPDDFFVVKSGTFAVIARGERGREPTVINSLQPGDYFGEIGLLEGMPRTATVQATTDAVVYRIPGDAFLDAVSQAPSMSPDLLSGMVGRLARTHPSYELTSKPAVDGV